MALYFFWYVPYQLDYFLGAKFRTLAVATGQVKSKVDALQQALNGAVRAVPPFPLVPNEKGEGQAPLSLFRTYVANVLPAIQLDSQCPTEFAFTTSGLCWSGTHGTANVAWDAVVVQAGAASARDFDDLLIADQDGVVLWQRERTTPRIGTLRELLNGTTAARGWLPSWAVRTTTPNAKESEAPIPQTALLKEVNLDGSLSLLLVQSLTLASGGGMHRMHVAGMISESALQSQARHIPTVWIVWAALPVVLLFLGLPFIKLATLKPKERDSFADVVLMAGATVVILGIGVILMFVPASVDDLSDKRLSGTR
jgi:hypothetical protein